MACGSGTEFGGKRPRTAAGSCGTVRDLVAGTSDERGPGNRRSSRTCRANASQAPGEAVGPTSGRRRAAGLGSRVRQPAPARPGVPPHLRPYRAHHHRAVRVVRQIPARGPEHQPGETTAAAAPTTSSCALWPNASRPVAACRVSTWLRRGRRGACPSGPARCRGHRRAAGRSVAGCPRWTVRLRRARHRSRADRSGQQSEQELAAPEPAELGDIDELRGREDHESAEGRLRELRQQWPCEQDDDHRCAQGER